MEREHWQRLLRWNAVLGADVDAHERPTRPRTYSSGDPAYPFTVPPREQLHRDGCCGCKTVDLALMGRCRSDLLGDDEWSGTLGRAQVREVLRASVRTVDGGLLLR